MKTKVKNENLASNLSFLYIFEMDRSMISKLIQSQLTSNVCLKFKNQSTLYCEVAITFLTEIILLFLRPL
jgi:hypothetical protein